MEQKNIWRIITITTMILSLVVIGYVVYNTLQAKFYTEGYNQGNSDALTNIGIEQARTSQIILWNGEEVVVVPLTALCGG